MAANQPIDQFMTVLTLVGFPFFILSVWAIWMPVRWRGSPRRPVDGPRMLVDRIGWTIFAAGIALMLTMTLFALGQESDGSWRPLATIRLHSRILLGFAALTLAGPLGAFLFGPRPVAKKSSADDPLA
jgi:hypothetical protein